MVYFLAGRVLGEFSGVSGGLGVPPLKLVYRRLRFEIFHVFCAYSQCPFLRRHTDQGITNFEGQEVDSPGDGQSSWWTPDKIHNCPFTVRDSPYGNRGGLRPGLPYPNLPDAKPTISMNSLAVLRGNSIDAAGSIWIGWYASGVIVESNLLDGGDDGVIVSNTTLDGITVRGNVARAPAN